MTIIKDPKKIQEVLTRGVAEILPSREKLAALMQKRKIRLYLGIDPTSSKLHLGHTVALKKLKEFQDLGHEVIFLVGDFTAQIGDPSGRDKKRKPLSVSQIKKNFADYKKQVAKVLELSKVKIKYNSKWLSQLKAQKFLELCSRMTVSRLLERDMFQTRQKYGREIWLAELLYPLMQGYDSVVMNVDLEVGGTDQTFNMLIGRKLQRIYNKKEKFVLTVPLLLGTDGRKMSKSYGNTIDITDSPDEMYGKIMASPDSLIKQYFELCTKVPLQKITEMEKAIKTGRLNPRDAKAELAQEIVSLYHGKAKAKKAAEEFEKVFRYKKIPSRVKKIILKEKKLKLVDLLTKTKLAFSRTEAKRLVLQGGVRLNGKVKENWQELIKIKKGQVLQVGKRKFVKIV